MTAIDVQWAVRRLQSDSLPFNFFNVFFTTTTKNIDHIHAVATILETRNKIIITQDNLCQPNVDSQFKFVLIKEDVSLSQNRKITPKRLIAKF